MWIVFSILAISGYTLNTLFSKKRINVGDDNQLTVVFYCNLVNALYFAGIYFFGASESGFSPFVLIVKYPAAFVCTLSIFLYELFALLSLQYLTVSRIAPFFNLSPVISFIALFVIFKFTGTNLGASGNFSLIRIVALSLIFAAIFIVFIIEKREVELEKTNDITITKKHLIIGYAFLTMAIIFDSLDVISSSFLFAINGIGENDMLSIYGASSIVVCVFLYVYLVIKNKKMLNIFRIKKEKDAMLAGVFSMVGMIFYAYAQNLSPLFAPILIYTCCVFEVLVGIFFFKEKIGKDHLFALGIVIIAILLFSLGELI